MWLYVVGSNRLKLHFGYQFINFLKTYFKKVSYIIYTIINASYEDICAKFERKNPFVFLLQIAYK